MGEWIKNNKFEAVLLVVVLVIAGGAFFLANKAGGRYELARDSFEGASRDITNFQQAKPSPTEPNKKAFGRQLVDFGKKVENIRNDLLTYRPKEFNKIAPSEFTNRLNANYEKLKALYTSKGIQFPEEKWRLGFEQYTASPPRDEATAYLDYQLQALTWLFAELAKTNPSELRNVYRAPLPVERANRWTPSPRPAAAGVAGGRTRPRTCPIMPFRSN